MVKQTFATIKVKVELEINVVYDGFVDKKTITNSLNDYYVVHSEQDCSHVDVFDNGVVESEIVDYGYNE